MDRQFVFIEITSNYARLILKRKPVNSMNLEVWIQLDKALTDLENNQNIRGVIIQSGLDRNVFIAGNDLMELYAPKTSAER
jgi:3,2-trans-enoyl-CoA isomerase